MTESTEAITIRLEGARAKGGLPLADFEGFIEHFLGALRDFDRDERGEFTKKTGHPDSRALAITSFRLVAFRKGSGIATIEPEVAEPEGDSRQMMVVEPIQTTNLRTLLRRVEAEDVLPVTVVDALDKARSSAGTDGTLSVEMAERSGSASPQRCVMIDQARISRMRDAAKTHTSAQSVTSVSGRLHRVDFEPDKLAIRASDGLDWSCNFPASLESKVERMVNRLVWASGQGEVKSPRRGAMSIDTIEAVEEGAQASLFSESIVADRDLESAQGIEGPQGLDCLAASDWNEEDEAYFEALSEI